jgi:hypothetical protein
METEMQQVARELFECLMERVYTPQLDAETGLTDRERAAIEAFLDLEGDEDEVETV